MSKLLVGSLEFGGINHYTILYIRNDRTWIQKLILPDASSYAAVNAASYRRGVAIGEPAASLWLHIVPWGIHKLLKCVKGKYGNSPVIIAENGMDDLNTPFISLNRAVQDDKRMNTTGTIAPAFLQLQGKTIVMFEVILGGPDKREWNSGYRNNLTRTPKASAEWFKSRLELKDNLQNVYFQSHLYVNNSFFLCFSWFHFSLFFILQKWKVRILTHSECPHTQLVKALMHTFWFPDP
ncbi:hypothetical protein NC653_028045 [Populus alba x Populus x berolinensis]|uniref:Uncharacterized protein n=1 Tax=Populus alba x Populus x berolinensis TaxID=444605 RepID=A0AAD6M7U4_9ROSI|nr:hypothetical protein NC653_028045 [Populus alba x Populus x berolinensis]